MKKSFFALLIILGIVVLAFAMIYFYVVAAFKVAILPYTITTFAVINGDSQSRVYDFDPCDLEVVECPTNNPIRGKASWYDYITDEGWSSIGHRVCASRDFAKYETISITNLANGRRVDCLVTDHGPDIKAYPDRVVDLSSYAFSLISDLKVGEIDVKVELIK